MKIYTYKVTGEKPFPIVMLRLSCAWPANAHEAKELQRLLENPSDDEWIVQVESIKMPPTVQWETLGWKVSDIHSFVVDGLPDQEERPPLAKRGF